MKVYEVSQDLVLYQGLTPRDQDAWRCQGVFDGTPKARTWIPMDVEVLFPKRDRGNFLSLSVGMCVLDTHAAGVLGGELARCCELLPVSLDGEQLFALNVLACIDMLDQEKTVWVCNGDVRIRIKQHAFLLERWTGAQLFKIPEQRRSRFFTLTGTKRPEREFMRLVEEHGLTGLRFKEVWNDESH